MKAFFTKHYLRGACFQVSQPHVCVSSLLMLTENNTSLCLCHRLFALLFQWLKDSWAASSLGDDEAAIHLNRGFCVNIYTYMYFFLFPSLWGKLLVVGLAGYTACVYSTFCETAKLFPQIAAPFHLPINNLRGVQLLCILIILMCSGQ